MTAPLLADSELLRVVETLPTSPQLLAELGPRLQGAEVDLAEVTGLLRRDAGLTARLIAMANSAAYARAEPAASLEEAVACIGYREVYRLIGAVAAAQIADEPLHYYGVDGPRLRQNALFVALVMEELAESVGCDARAAYTMGLLRSIGKIALDRLGRQNPASVPFDSRSTNLTAWERSQWGRANGDAAAIILRAWRFPEETVVAIRDHYTPGDTHGAAVHMLNIASGAADFRSFGLPGEADYWQFTQENFGRSGVDEGKLVWAGERAFRTLQRICSALG